jgi:hypothetical protein
MKLKCGVALYGDGPTTSYMLNEKSLHNSIPHCGKYLRHWSAQARIVYCEECRRLISLPVDERSSSTLTK